MEPVEAIFRGKMNFSNFFVAGRVGALVFSLLSDKQDWSAPGIRIAESESPERRWTRFKDIALRWSAQSAKDLPPRVALCGPGGRPVLVFTDGSCENDAHDVG